MDMVSSATVAKKGLSHSLKYRAAKAEREKQRKRRLEEEQQQAMAIDTDDQQPKRPRFDTEAIDPARLNNLISKTVSLLAKNIKSGTSTFYNSVYTDEKTRQEYKEADARQREHEIKTYTLARKVADELKDASVDELAPRTTDLRRAGVYLEDVN
jgi:chromatin structure-remodeling complex subunit RSC1/2